jgi:p70 ribosomal S6 kinase
MYKVIEALSHIHSVGIAHRDLKPENIMIDREGNPKIIDFGLSKDTWGQTRQLKSIVGSKVYMAPEILRGEPHGIACDMWSIGIILFTMLSSSFPFNFKNLDKEILNSPVLFIPVDQWKDISHEARNLITLLLSK